jgi:hypothetical protein
MMLTLLSRRTPSTVAHRLRFRSPTISSLYSSTTGKTSPRTSSLSPSPTSNPSPRSSTITSPTSAPSTSRARPRLRFWRRPSPACSSTLTSAWVASCCTGKPPRPFPLDYALTNTSQLRTQAVQRVPPAVGGGRRRRGHGRSRHLWRRASCPPSWYVFMAIRHGHFC